MMNKDKNLKAFVFDFGATLDTGGIHWYNVFFDQYTKEFPYLSDKIFREAYVYAERNLSKKYLVKPTDTFKDTL